MSNPLAGTPYRFFQLPQFLFTDKLHQQLGGKELSMLVALYYESHRTTKITMQLSHKAVVRLTGISTSKVGAARTGLVNHGLIAVKRVDASYAYTLCAPATGEPIKAQSKKGQNTDFDLFTPDQLRLYYSHHLANNRLRDSANGLEACCPFHDDHSPSLSISLTDGSKWQCHGCNRKGKVMHFEQAIARHRQGDHMTLSQARIKAIEVMTALGIIDSTTGQPEATYPYVDEDGVVEFEVLRYLPKGFKQRRTLASGKVSWDVQGCRKIPYRLPEVMQANTVVVVEGEKDADRLHSLCLYDDSSTRVAVTTNAGGVGKWTGKHAAYLKGKKVLLIGHNDDGGQKHMADVAVSLEGIASEVAMMKLPEDVNDVAEYLEKNPTDFFLDLIPVSWVGESPF